jgi:hypothetical protein
VLVARDFGVPTVSYASTTTLVPGDTLRQYTVHGNNFATHAQVYIWSEPSENDPLSYSYHQVAMISATKETIVARVRGWDPTLHGTVYLHVMNPDSTRSNSIPLNSP